MILIVGQNEDDILYFRSRFTGKEAVEKLPGNLTAYRGQFGNEDMVIAAIGQGNPITAMNTATLIDRYDPYLVVNTGSCLALKQTMHQGDLVMADRYYSRSTDFSLLEGGEYGQYPGIGPYITFINETSNKARSAAYDVTNRFIARGYIISGNSILYKSEDANSLIKEHYSAIKNLVMAFDCSSYGIALACYRRRISLLTIRVVGAELDKPETLLSCRRVTLEAMPEVGSILAQLLIDKQNQFTAMQEEMD